MAVDLARVIMANPLQVKAIAHAYVKTDKIDAGVLASLQAAGFLPEVWLPDAETERRRRLVARRNQIVRHRSRVKNETHAILAAHLVPPCPQAELFNGPGRAWLARQALPDDERAAITRHLRELDQPWLLGFGAQLWHDSGQRGEAWAEMLGRPSGCGTFRAATDGRRRTPARR